MKSLTIVCLIVVMVFSLSSGVLAAGRPIIMSTYTSAAINEQQSSLQTQISASAQANASASAQANASTSALTNASTSALTNASARAQASLGILALPEVAIFHSPVF